MVVTANDTFTTITIQSDNLTDFTDIDTVTLEGKINCEGTYSDTVVEGDVTLLTGTFTVDINALFGVSSLDDSVYTFVLTVLNDDESVTKEFGCLFVDNETKCNVAEYIKNGAEIELQLDYYILSRAGTGDCGCDCQTLCNIYQRVVNGLTSCQSC